MAINNIRTAGGIFTHHFIETLKQDMIAHPAVRPESFTLPGHDRIKEKELDKAIAHAWTSLVERWDMVEREYGSFDISDLRQRWIRPLFYHLKLEPEYQRADTVPESVMRFPISHMGRTGTTEFTIPIHSVLYEKDDTLDARAGKGRGVKNLAPHDMVQRYLNLSKKHDWGVVTDGVYLRLLRDFHHTYTRGYVEFDLQGIFGSRDFSSFRALYRLLHGSRFVVPQGEDQAPIDELYEDSLAMGVRVGEDLRKNVQEAIESLANGFLSSSPGFLDRVRDKEDGEGQLYRNILMTIYRMLFLLFAEQRGMLPGRGSLYSEEYSMTSLRTLAEEPFGEDSNVDLWEKFKTTISMVEHGVEEMGIFAYNGALFNLSRTSLLTPSDTDNEPKCRNDHFLNTIRHLTTVEKDKVQQRISYADLSVEEIGSIYESLLDFSPRISEIAVDVEGRELNANTFFLDPRGSGRKTTGSYYTPPSLVNELIKSALVPVMEERIRGVVPGYDSEYIEALTEAERQDAEEAILDINVVDPAAGSGAFLIAANNKLGLELARIRTGELFPAVKEVQQARRDVLANCIYAVDLNPMAVELCKVSLWINAAVEEAPLNFLDHHIKCGNSLIGASPELIKKGIPGDAYRPVTGDDKGISKSIKNQNREELKGQLSLPQVASVRIRHEHIDWDEISLMADNNPGQAETVYYAYFESDDYWARRLPFDIWTSAFFSPLKNDLVVPTTLDVRKAQEDHTQVSKALFAHTHNLAKKYGFFHWHLEFTDVFNEEGVGGFDVVLGNPPWELLNLMEKEFFEYKAPEIASARTGAVRKELILNLKSTNQRLWTEYTQELRKVDTETKFIKESSRFPLTAKGRLNTYSIFSEAALHLINREGKGGLVVPTGIATDYYNSVFFSYLVDNHHLYSLFDFENKKNVFPGIGAAIKFCLLTLQKKNDRRTNPEIEFAFFLLDPDELANNNKKFTLDKDDFKRINPNTGSCPVFSSKLSADITKKIYRNSEVVDNENASKNPWNTMFMQGLFNVTSDSSLFKTKQDMSEGFVQEGNLYCNEDTLFPLYEAKYVNIYDHRSGTFEGKEEEHIYKTKAATNQLSSKQKEDPQKLIIPRYWVPKSDIDRKIPEYWKHDWFIGFRDVIQPMTNARCSIFSPIPKYAVGNQLPLIFPLEIDIPLILLFIANLNSFVFDYVTRQKIGGAHLNFYIVKQLPIVLPSRFNNQLLSFIVPRVMELVYTAWDLKPFADDVWSNSSSELRGLINRQWEENATEKRPDHQAALPPSWLKHFQDTPISDSCPLPPFVWSDIRRIVIQCAIDAVFGHLYGLTQNELEYILDTFPIVKRKEEERYGEYLSKRTILTEFERMAGNPMLVGTCVPLHERASVLGTQEKAQDAQFKKSL